MSGTPLILDDKVRNDLRELRALAHKNPVQVIGLLERLQTPDGKAQHMAQMTRQTIAIPLAYLVTFSIESGQPSGLCRHMSMSVQREGRAPNEHALWMVAQELGFWGSLNQCAMWPEKLLGHGLAINLVQPVLASEEPA